MKQPPRHRRLRTRVGSRVKALATLAVVLVAAVAVTGFSSATFTSSSAATLGTVRSASDWTPPTVTMQNPGSSVRGSATLTANASDADSGIKDVTIQVQPAEGAGWTTVCTTTSTPYGCSWDTTSVADGTYSVRAVATDNAGYVTTSDSVQTIVANRLTVVLTDPGDAVRGNVSLSTAVYNSGLATYTTTVQYAPAGTTSWKTACTNLLLSSCTWNTASVPNGTYDLRSVVSVALGATYYSATVTDVDVDNTAPSVAMTDPGTPLSGTRTFTATASDADSGLAQVVIQYALSGSSTFKTLCTVVDTPYACRFDTTTLAGGTYSFRAVATDAAGNVTTSSTVTNRVVDNTVSSVSVEDPGQYLSGTVGVTSTAAAVSGVTSVRIQQAPAGTSTWTDLCSTATAPYTCSWNTTTVSDGSYDLRAVLLDRSGRTTTSAVLSSRIVDNSVSRGVDIQATNGTGTAGKVDNGDSLTYTYSERLTTTSVLAGWDGSSTAVTVRLRDGNLVGRGNSGDTVDVLKGTAAVNLGSVVLNRDFIKNNKTATFNATMVASTSVSGGVTRSVITVRLGSVASGGSLRTVSAGNTANLTWTPSAAAVDLAGNKCSVATVTETGILDRDF